MNRKFVNLVVRNCGNYCTNEYSLRRINLSRLFYPSTADAEPVINKENAEKKFRCGSGFLSLPEMAESLGPLPFADISFKPSGASGAVGDVDGPSLDFAALLGDENRVLVGDAAGRCSIYEADRHAVLTAPSLRAPKGRGAIPLYITSDPDAPPGTDTEDSFYVMSKTLGRSCFEELCYFSPFALYPWIHGWRSHSTPLRVTRTIHPGLRSSAWVRAHAVVGGSRIYASFCNKKSGPCTCCFDTASGEWSHVGNWSLPFFGRGEYVPELKLWLGVSQVSPFHLLATDLSAMDTERPPAVQHTWVEFDTPEGWIPFQMDIVRLGSGRFCVVRHFEPLWTSHDERRVIRLTPYHVSDEDLPCRDCYDVTGKFAVLTGVEVVRCDGEAPGGELRMFKHKSRFHTFEDHSIKWVL